MEFRKLTPEQRDKLKSCTGKNKYFNEAFALHKARITMLHTGYDWPLQAYHCRHGDHWHIGHEPRHQRAAEAAIDGI